MVSNLQSLLINNKELIQCGKIWGLGWLQEWVQEWVETFKMNFTTNVLGYSLAICTIVGTVSLFLKIMGFNTQKWAILSAATFLFILAVVL